MTSARPRRADHGCRGICRVVHATAVAHPLPTILSSLLLAVGGVLYAVHALTFMTSGRDLLPQDQPYVQRDREYGRDFSETNEIIVAVEAPGLAAAKAYARRLVGELDGRPDQFQRVTYRIDPKHFRRNALLYLSTDELSELRDEILDYRRFLTSFATRPTLDQLVDGVRTQVVTAFVASAFDLGVGGASNDIDLSVVRDLLAQISTRLDHPGPYRSPWRSLFTLGTHGDEEGFFLSDDERLLFVLVEPVDRRGSFTDDRETIETLRATITRLRPDFPDVQVGVTGAPALSNDEMVSAFRDSARATLLAFVLTLGLLVLAFRRVGMPLVMLVTLAVSLCWSMGIITLVVGHLSIFSVMFVSIVIGIGIDYGIYFLFRYDEELALGLAPGEALRKTAARSGPGTLAGALTAAGTFYVLMATDFPGIRELGFIAGTSILSAWVAMTTLFPACLVSASRWRAGARSVRGRPQAGAGVTFVERITAYPRTVLGGAALLGVLALVGTNGVFFDYNLLHLQAAGTESVVWEHRILETAGRSSFTGLATAGSLDELREKAAAFKRLGSVSEVDSALRLVPSDQESKRRIVGEFAPIVASVRASPRLPVDLDRLVGALRTLERRFDLAATEAPIGRDRDEVVGLRDQTAALARKLQATDPRRATAALTHLQADVRRDFARTLRRFQRSLQPGVVGLEDIPEELRRRFIGRSGRFLLEMHPRVNIWDREGAERFVSELRSVDPEVTGIPIIGFEATRYMEAAYKDGTVYAFVLVAVLAALSVRRRRETMLALLPLALGTLWTVGLMSAFGLPFNLGNVFGFPLIIGAGAEFGLNIVLRYREGRERGGPLVGRATVMAVLLNGLTTVGGFGSLMIADHRGIFGLGLLLTLGMVATLAASLVVLPVALRFTETASEPQPALPDGRRETFSLAAERGR